MFCPNAVAAHTEVLNTYVTLAESFLRWRAARPFIFAGADPYSRSILFAMIEQLEQAKAIAATMQWHDYVQECELSIQVCLRRINEKPPPLGPAPKRGFLFSIKKQRRLALWLASFECAIEQEYCSMRTHHIVCADVPLDRGGGAQQR